MTALAAGRFIQEWEPLTVHRDYTMATSTQIWQGGIVVLNSSGLAVPASAATGLTAVGVAMESKLSNSTAGSTVIKVHVGVFQVNVDSTMTVANIGNVVYALDD